MAGHQNIYFLLEIYEIMLTYSASYLANCRHWLLL